MEWAVCAASSDSEDATAQESNEEDGSPSKRKRQDSLYRAGEQPSNKDAHKSVDLMFDKEAASTRNSRDSMDSVKAEAGKKALDKESQDLTHFEKQQGFKRSAPDIMASTCLVNISEEGGIPDHDPKDFTVETMPEGDKEELDLVTQEDLGELAKELEFDSPTSKNGVSQKVNHGRSEVQRKMRNLTEDVLEQASKLVKRLEHPQKDQFPCTSTECGESALGPSCSQWIESFHSKHLEGNRATQERVNSTESKEMLSRSSESVDHQAVHTGKGMYHCAQCNVTCRNTALLDRHRLEHHIFTETPYRCPECNKYFATADSMSEHRFRFHYVKNLFQYRECNFRFDNLLLLNQHRYIAHNTEIRFKCPECDEHFVSADGMSNHRLLYHNVDKPFQCTECTFTFNSLYLRTRHHLMAHEARCPECYRCFPDESSVLKHCFMVHFQCIDCDITFNRALDLNKHHCMAHGTEESFKCPDCNAQSFNADMMKQHRLIIHNVKEFFSCPDCREKFISLQFLMVHKGACTGVHGTEESFKCPDCNAQCFNADMMKQHRLIHNVKDYFSCPDCREKFISLNFLMVHKGACTGVHGTEESFKCPDCNAQCFNADMLKQHRLIIHNVKEYFSCPGCRREFTSLHFLKVHQDACTGGRPVQCTECNIILKNESRLRQHELKVHNIKPQFSCTDYTNAFSVDETFDW